jgi:hypothetical protein
VPPATIPFLGYDSNLERLFHGQRIQPDASLAIHFNDAVL